MNKYGIYNDKIMDGRDHINGAIMIANVEIIDHNLINWLYG